MGTPGPNGGQKDPLKEERRVDEFSKLHVQAKSDSSLLQTKLGDTIKRQSKKLIILKEKLSEGPWPYSPMAFFPLALLPYAVYCVGLSPFWALPISFLGLSYLHNVAEHHKIKTSMQLANEPRVVRAITKHLPTWFFDSEVERGLWLSQCVKKFWPAVVDIIEKNAPDRVKPILDYLDCRRPAFIDEVRITKMWLGTIPIVVCGVRFVSTDDDMVQLDLDIKWAGDSKLNLELGYKGWPLVIEVSKIVLRGKVRLELGPLVPRLPILSGAVNLTFMEEPFLDFDIKVAALPVAGIGVPDLSVGDTVAWVIRECVFRDSMYYPSRLVIPILKDIVDRKVMKRRNVSGRLGLTILSASKLKAADYTGLSDPYVKITYRPQNQIFRTAWKAQTLNPVWDQEFWVDIFTLHEPLHLEVKDHDVMGASDPIGDVVLPLEELEFTAMKPVEKELTLENVNTGKLKVRLMFVPASNPAFTMFEDDLEDEDEEAELTENYGIVNQQESPSESSANLVQASRQSTPSEGDKWAGGGGLSSSKTDPEAIRSAGQSLSPTDEAAMGSPGDRSSKAVIPEGIMHLSNIVLMGYRMKGGFGGGVAVRCSLQDVYHSTKTMKGPCTDPHYMDTLTFRVPGGCTNNMDVVVLERNPMTGEKVVARASVDLKSFMRKAASKTELIVPLPHKNKDYRVHLTPTFIKSATIISAARP